MSLSTLFRGAAFYGSMLVIGALVLAFNGVSWVWGLLARGGDTDALFQRLIQRQAVAYWRWLAWVGLVHVEYRNWERARWEQAVIVANHPGMLDAFLLLARVPRGVCVFKNAIRRNPFLGAVAERAGYLSNDRPVELVRGATEKISRGATLIIFPEGTRTRVGQELGRLRPGFALIARRAGVPVQLVRISSDGALFTKHGAWWKLPQLPAHVVVQVGPALAADAFPSTEALVAAADAWFRATPEPHAQLTPGLGAPLTAS